MIENTRMKLEVGIMREPTGREELVAWGELLVGELHKGENRVMAKKIAWHMPRDFEAIEDLLIPSSFDREALKEMMIEIGAYLYQIEDPLALCSLPESKVSSFSSDTQSLLDVIARRSLVLVPK
jgi:hypothetical protein